MNKTKELPTDESHLKDPGYRLKYQCGTCRNIIFVDYDLKDPYPICPVCRGRIEQITPFINLNYKDEYFYAKNKMLIWYASQLEIAPGSNEESSGQHLFRYRYIPDVQWTDDMTKQNILISPYIQGPRQGEYKPEEVQINKHIAYVHQLIKYGFNCEKISPQVIKDTYDLNNMDFLTQANIWKAVILPNEDPQQRVIRERHLDILDQSELIAERDFKEIYNTINSLENSEIRLRLKFSQLIKEFLDEAHYHWQYKRPISIQTVSGFGFTLDCHPRPLPLKRQE